MRIPLHKKTGLRPPEAALRRIRTVFGLESEPWVAAGAVTAMAAAAAAAMATLAGPMECSGEHRAHGCLALRVVSHVFLIQIQVSLL